MPVTNSKRTPEELAQLALRILERQILPLIHPEDEGKFVAINVGTGDFEIDPDDYAAVMRLRSRQVSAEVWLGRIGQPAAYRMRHGR